MLVFSDAGGIIDDHCLIFLFISVAEVNGLYIIDFYFVVNTSGIKWDYDAHDNSSVFKVNVFIIIPVTTKYLYVK